MKYYIIGSLFLVSLVAAAGVDHRHHEEHAHKHGLDCGHAAEWHVDHFDYEHDGHDHH